MPGCLIEPTFSGASSGRPTGHGYAGEGGRGLRATSKLARKSLHTLDRGRIVGLYDLSGLTFCGFVGGEEGA